jgi:hypothetical protein
MYCSFVPVRTSKNISGATAAQVAATIFTFGAAPTILVLRFKDQEV